MADADPHTVFVAENNKVADAVIALLASAGIGAEAVAQPHRSETEPLTGMTEIAAGGAIDIRVVETGKVNDARGLIDSAVAAGVVKAIREKRAGRTGTVTAVCEECGKSSDWLAAAMGTTENCPHCTAYMDIPDPDDDWSDVDFGEPEGENEDSK